MVISRSLVKRRLVAASFKLHGFPKIDKDRKEKKCHACGKTRDIDEFNRCRSRKDGRSATCRGCWAKYQADRTMQVKFGMTQAQYDAMLEQQSGGCAICGNRTKMMHRGRAQRLPIDHCHRTGKVRGILCSNCNNGLGRFKDDTVLLEKAAQYLQR